MADRHAGSLHLVRDRAEREALIFQLTHPPDRHLLLWHLDQLACLADAVAVGWGAAQVAPALALIAFHLGDALTRAVALGLGDGGQDGGQPR